VILFGSEYWGGLIDWLRERVVAEGKLDPDESELFTVCDDPAEVPRLVREAVDDAH
jgi:predicted Rossmann-fold nucleotide-binding protein